MPENNITNIPSSRVELIDPRTGLMSRQWYRFFLNLFDLTGSGNNITSLDDLQIGPPSGGGESAFGTVTSVAMTVPTGLSVAGSPITSAGTLAVSYSSGYSIPTTAKQTEWDTAYSERLQWDGGTTNLVAATGRTSLGATTVGSNFFTLPNPSAITFVRINADNTVSTLDAPTFRTAIGAGVGSGDVVGPSSATDNAVARYDTTTGKLIQNSLVLIDDTGSVTGVNALTAESLTVNNNATFGTSNSDTINFVGRINSDFDPATDNTYDLGRVGHEWRDLYIDGTANIDSLIADTADINAGTIDNTTIGATTPQNGSFVNLSVTGTTSFDGSQGTSGQVLTSAGTGNTPTWTTPTTGTVTSVTGTAPVVSSGGNTPAISLAANYGDTQNPYASKTANFVLAAPNGSAGAPTFRAIVAADIPTLNQNTTGTASNVTGTVAIANGGTGATTAAAARTALGATTVGGNMFTLVNPSAVTFPRFNADNTVSALDAATFRTAIGAGTSSTTGTVTSVGGTGTVNGITLTGTVTSSGNLTLGGTLSGVSLATQVTGTLPIANGGTGETTRQAAIDALAGAVTSGQYLRGNGTDVVMSAIQAADVPTLNQNTTGSAATLTTARNLWGQSFNGSADISAPLYPALGSVSLPAYSASGDTNTGMYFPAADTIAFTEGGVESMRIDSSGNLGIGTTNPTSKLFVEGTVQARTGGTGISMFGDGGSGYVNSVGAFPLIFQTNSTERVRLTNAGNLGVGTNNPQTRLQVTQDGGAELRVQTPTSGNPRISLLAEGAVYNYFESERSTGSLTTTVNGSERMRIDGSGRVLIGTTTAAAKLDVRSTSGLPSYLESSANPTNAVMMSISNQTITSNNGCKIALDAYNIGGVALGIPTGDAALAFYTNSQTAERMRIDSSGNLLVRTTTASYSATNRGNITIGGTASAILGFQKSGVAKGYVYLDGSDNMQLWNESNTSLIFGTNALERMRINGSGSLLVGTTTPIFASQFTNTGNVACTFYRATSATDNALVAFYSDVGGTQTFKAYVNTTGAYENLSDERYKEDIEPISTGLNIVLALNPVSFNWKNSKDSKNKTNGFIAQQVESVYPEAIKTIDASAGGGYIDQRMIQSDMLLPVLVKAIQELKEELDSVKAELQTLKGS
jgi:hypothetical protein